jgi:membrane-bound lytic murein transglycosylase F
MTKKSVYINNYPSMNTKKVNVLMLTIILALVATSVSGFSEQPIFPTFTHNFSDYELMKFEQHTQKRLPNYIDHFKKYSEEYEVPWTLLAAVAYQESKWNHKAVSFTGVRGLMQITEKTAEHIGITDREDPVESIRGGAYYLRYLYDKTSEEISSQQRWAHALAAYNIGWGHFRDAYRLAKKLNKNPYSWNELKTVLPKLEEIDHSESLKFGYARGTETVEFVENVFSYYGILNSEIVASN